MTDQEPLDLGTTELSADERNDVDRRARTRANLLPEELDTGSADPEAQAREVLRDSDLRTENPESAPGTMAERGE